MLLGDIILCMEYGFILVFDFTGNFGNEFFFLVKYVLMDARCHQEVLFGNWANFKNKKRFFRFVTVDSSSCYFLRQFFTNK